MRVAVSQFATSSNAQENLASCIRMINEVATCDPALIVLPEYCNTQFCHSLPCYADHNQAWNAAVTADGDFVQAIAEQAKKHSCYIVLNVTLRRDLVRDHQNGAVKSNISVTSCLFSPLGELINQTDKQTLMGHEKDFFISASKISEVVTETFGKLGLLSGSDSITFEASRELALTGAQLLCNPLSSFALDHSCLHGPARACENNVFLATANKIGELMPAEYFQQKNSATPSPQSLISPAFLIGSGQSQIVSPTGKVLAKIDNDDEGFIFADINLSASEVGLNNKFRPDGTQIIKQRRPELYLPAKQVPSHEQIEGKEVPETANIAIFATYKTNEQAIEDVCFYIENNLSDIIQLPELFFIADKAITHNAEQLAQIASLSEQLINQISSVLRPFQYVCTSLVIEGMHQAVLIGEDGLFATQQQLHFCERYKWTALGDDLNIVNLPLEQGNINVAMLTADDANIPEIVNVAAANNVHVLLVPFDIQEPNEVEFSLLSRAAENRICIVAGTREKNFANDTPPVNSNINNKSKVKSQKSTGLIANLTTEFGLLSQWKTAKFTGSINQPLVKHQYGKITKALVHPIAACYKQLD